MGKRNRCGGVVRFPDREGFWCRWKRNGHVLTRYGGRTKAGAERQLVRVHALILDGVDLETAIRHVWNEPDPDTEVLTWKEVTERYLSHLEVSGARTPENLSKERSRASALLKSPLARIEVDTTERASVARWLDGIRTKKTRRGKPRSPKTLNRFLAFGSAIWRFAQERGYAPEDVNPFRQIKRAKEEPLDKNPLFPDELAALLRRADPDFRDLLLAAAHTGCRASELQRLTWGDVDSEGRCIRIRASHEKTKRGRTIGLTDALCGVQACRPRCADPTRAWA